MDKRKPPLSVRLSDSEKAFLEKIAVKNNLYNFDDKPLLSSALKLILRERMNDQKSQSSDKKIDLNSEILKMKKMLEQIHVSIPNMACDMQIVSNYTQELIYARNDNKQLFNVVKSSVDETLKNTYGAFQTYNYDTLHCSINHRNMKTIPIEKDKNRWK